MHNKIAHLSRVLPGVFSAATVPHLDPCSPIENKKEWQGTHYGLIFEQKKCHSNAIFCQIEVCKKVALFQSKIDQCDMLESP